VNDRIRVTAEVLEYVALNMAGLAGRKNLIWLSGRFPFSFEPRSDFTSQEVSGRLTQLERTARALTDANVAIYPISAVGLLAPEFNAPGAALFPTTTNVGGRLAREPASTNTMPQIARMTGGEAHYLTNGLAEAMLTATEDAEVIYTLAFYPDAVSPDDAFHDLRVEVARDGVEVRHRRGYYGFGIPDGSEESARVPAMNLVASPVNATGIGLTARTVPSASVEEGSITYLSADVGDLRLRLGEDRWVGSVEIATLIIEANGSDPRVDVGTLDIVLTPEAYQEAVAAGVYELLRLGSIGAGPAWLRIVVREPTSGAAGSLWVAFE
jgi:hypothetical protein